MCAGEPAADGLHKYHRGEGLACPLIPKRPGPEGVRDGGQFVSSFVSSSRWMAFGGRLHPDERVLLAVIFVTSIFVRLSSQAFEKEGLDYGRSLGSFL